MSDNSRADEVVARIKAEREAAAKAKQERLDALHAEYAARCAAAAEEREREEQARAEALRQKQLDRLDRTYKQTYRQAYLAGGGSAADFEKEWPKMRTDLATKDALDALETARREMARSMARNF